LADEGRVQENKMGGEPARFEVPRQRHYHIWCVECGRLEDLTLPYQDALDRKAQRLVRFRLEQHRMEFFGVCPECGRERRPRKQDKQTKARSPGRARSSALPVRSATR
jgi:Fe2+ or Zn2+ uptake regulation protein